jgi:hypothetical protein
MTMFAAMSDTIDGLEIYGVTRTNTGKKAESLVQFDVAR